MTLEDIAPKNRNDKMSDRLWATYSAITWCCNSLNSYGGRFIHMASSKEPIVISAHEAESVWRCMNRAQEVIMALLDETGRLKEFDEWEKGSLNKENYNE